MKLSKTFNSSRNGERSSLTLTVEFDPSDMTYTHPEISVTGNPTDILHEIFTTQFWEIFDSIDWCEEWAGYKGDMLQQRAEAAQDV